MDMVWKGDILLLCSLRKWERKNLTTLMQLFTKMGDASGWAYVSVVFMIFERTVFGLGMMIGIASLSGAIMAQVVKHLIRRKRPVFHSSCPQALVSYPDEWSFPSGHSTSAFTVAGVLLFVAPWLFFAFLALAVLIATSRVYLGVHYPSDVIAGALLGGLVSFSMATMMISIFP